MPARNLLSPSYHLPGNRKIQTGSGNLKFLEEGLGETGHNKIIIVIKAVHLAEIYKKVHGFFLVSPTVSPDKFENRSTIALPGKTWNLDAVSRFLGFFLGNA